MNSFGAMTSTVKQPLPSVPTVLAPPTISNSSPSKVTQPPNLTPLNLNTTPQSIQPLSLVNEHKNVPVFVHSSENIQINAQKSSVCNGVPDGKPTILEKTEGGSPIIESKLSNNQTNDTDIVVKNLNEPLVSESKKPQASEAENLSPKKDDKSNVPTGQPEKKSPGVVTETPANEPVKLDKSLKPDVVVAKPKENVKANQEPTENQGSMQTNQEQTSSPGKIEQSSPNTSKSAVRRKREHKQLDGEDEDNNEKPLKKDTSTEEIKSKRTRLPTQPFQLSLPEMQLIGKITEKPASSKPSGEKLTVFYKNEFLAVRNEEGGFFLCQAVQNIHRASRRIRIRWLSQLPNDEFTPDFYDHTEFDCILTNITLKKIQKEQWKLPEKEKLRIENILKRSIDVEKGSEKPSVTEEHPDGLDVSLYKDEAQLTKKKVVKKSTSAKRKVSVDEQPVKKSSRLSKKKPSYDFGHSSSESDEDDDTTSDTSDKKKLNKKIVKKKVNAKEPVKKPSANVSKPKPAGKKTPASVKPTYVLASVSSALKKRDITTTKQKKENSVVDKKSSSKKVEPKSPAVPLLSERSSKPRNAGNAVSAKITTAGIGVVKSSTTTKDRKALRNRK